MISCFCFNISPLHHHTCLAASPASLPSTAEELHWPKIVMLEILKIIQQMHLLHFCLFISLPRMQDMTHCIQHEQVVIGVPFFTSFLLATRRGVCLGVCAVTRGGHSVCQRHDRKVPSGFVLFVSLNVDLVFHGYWNCCNDGWTCGAATTRSYDAVLRYRMGLAVFLSNALFLSWDRTQLSECKP